MPAPEGVLLGAVELMANERRELRLRHKAAMTVVRQLPTAQERLELLKAVVWPSDELRDAVRELEEED